MGNEYVYKDDVLRSPDGREIWPEDAVRQEMAKVLNTSVFVVERGQHTYYEWRPNGRGAWRGIETMSDIAKLLNGVKQ
jgi:hypothetical protein